MLCVRGNVTGWQVRVTDLEDRIELYFLDRRQLMQRHHRRSVTGPMQGTATPSCLTENNADLVELRGRRLRRPFIKPS